MTLQQVEDLLSEIAKKKKIDSFVILGSLSVLGILPGAVPPEMTVSNEVDSYPEIDPGRADELAREWGQGTEYERRHGYYFDPISPRLPTFPSGWESRLLQRKTPSGATLKFADPNDVAISKYARGEEKDRVWIRAGLAASILSLVTIEYRLRDTVFLDQTEHERVKASVLEDKAWLKSRVKGGSTAE